MDANSAHQTWNEMLATENAGLRERVSALELKVQEQEDELVCLRSSMADVLRRLGCVESPARPLGPSSAYGDHARAKPGSSPRSAAKNLSRSVGNLRKHTSAVTLTDTPKSSTAGRRVASPSARRLLQHQQQPEQQNGPASAASLVDVRRATGRPQRASVSSSDSAASPAIRKWVSTQHFDHSAAQPTPPRRTPVSPSSRGQREPLFHAVEGVMQLHVHGRAVNLWAPSSVGVGFDATTPAPPPAETLRLDWVYGYRGRDCRSNVHLLPTGELVYFAATVVVLHNTEEQTQRHYTDHTDDVKCIAIHPNRLTIASGQGTRHNSLRKKSGDSAPSTPSSELNGAGDYSESAAHVRVWDSITLQTLHVLGAGELERAVSCVAFSRADGGLLLVAVDDSYEHTLSLWDWQHRRKLADAKSANEQVFSVDFHSTQRNALVACAKSHVSFWTYDGTLLQKRVGVFEGRERPKYVLCAALTDAGDALTGDSNGALVVWSSETGRALRHLPRAHSAAVFSLCVLKGGALVSGDKDGRLVEWSSQLQPTGRTATIPEAAGAIRTMTQGRGGLIVVGTTHNCILQGSLDLSFSYVVKSHSDEVWGLCAHPVQQQFVSCGHDRALHLWDAISHSLVWAKDVADAAHSVAFHPGGGVLVVGTTVGRWLAVDAVSRQVVVGVKDGEDIVSALAFSSAGDALAVGSHDGHVYVYAVSDDARRYSRLTICGPHPSFVNAIDWTDDGSHLRTNTGDREVFYWRAADGRAVTEARALRDAQWATQRCTVSFATAGLWRADGCELLGCDRAAQRPLLAAADDSGAVRLLSYPAPTPNAGSRDYAGHSCDVTAVRFLRNDCRLLSAGGKDCAVFQWAVDSH